MKIDYFCFSVPSLGTTDYSISENDDENTIWIKTKEQELMNAAKANDMLIVFDRSTKKFYMDSEEINVKDKTIFPRSFISGEKELLNQLDKNGALSIQTKEDYAKQIIDNIKTTCPELVAGGHENRSGGSIETLDTQKCHDWVNLFVNSADKILH